MKKRFTCTACNYKFYRNQQPKLCPMCGKPSVAADNPVLADDFLQDVE